MSLLDLGEIEGGQETPREYLERTLLLPSLEVAVEQMLKVCACLFRAPRRAARAKAGSQEVTLRSRLLFLPSCGRRAFWRWNGERRLSL
jgi:hypothetical protein